MADHLGRGVRKAWGEATLPQIALGDLVGVTGSLGDQQVVLELVGAIAAESEARGGPCASANALYGAFADPSSCNLQDKQICC